MKRYACSLLILLAACHPKVQPGRVEHEAGVPLPKDAEVVPVAAQNISPRIDVVGTVASERMVTLSSRLSAYVEDVKASAGDRVQSGQVLMTLDDREIQKQAAAAEAGLKQAEAEYNRARQLFEKNASTEQAVTGAESAFQAAKANVDRVQVMLSYAQVTAPFDGIVTERHVESGNLANPGQPLLTVYDPTQMRLEAPVPARLISRLQLGQGVQVTLDQSPNALTGQVTEIVSAFDPMSRTRKVKIQLPSAGADILPGTFGRLWIEEEARPTILVPASAVQRLGQLEYVNVVKNQRVLRRLVRTGPRRDDAVEILSGLAAGDYVLREGSAGHE